MLWIFTPMSHGVNKKAPTIASPHPSPYQVFTRFVCCFTRNNLSVFFCSDLTVYCKKKSILKIKQIFSFNLLLVSFDFAVSCMCFLGCFFTVLPSWKLWIASCLHTCIASYLASHQNMWYNKRIHGHGLKITSCCCFFIFWRN